MDRWVRDPTVTVTCAGLRAMSTTPVGRFTLGTTS